MCGGIASLSGNETSTNCGHVSKFGSERTRTEPITRTILSYDEKRFNKLSKSEAEEEL